MGFFSKPNPLELFSIVQSADPAIDIVFVHGLDGDAIKTWRMHEPESWASWISTHLPQANVFSLGYRLRSTGWLGGSMPLTSRAVSVLAALDVELVSKRPIIFVCHSYGGLLVKQMLRTATEIAVEYQSLTDRIAGIVFLGTPNSGATIASFAARLKPLLQTSLAIDELRRSEPLLQDLNLWFRRNAVQRKWRLRAYCEEIETHGVIVVDRSSADLGIPDNTPVPVDANHSDICKPTTRDSRVKQTLAMIEGVLQEAPKPRPQSWMSQILGASDSQLRFIEADLKAEIVRHPQDVDARRALAYLHSLSQSSFNASPSREAASHAPSFSARSLAAYATIVAVGFIGVALVVQLWPASQPAQHPSNASAVTPERHSFDLDGCTKPSERICVFSLREETTFTVELDVEKSRIANDSNLSKAQKSSALTRMLSVKARPKVKDSFEACADLALNAEACRQGVRISGALLF